MAGSNIELITDDDPPFQGGNSIVPQGQNVRDMIEAETTRAQQEAQAGFLVAKQFPRNEHDAIVRITRSCQRPTLAEKAMYAFPRGGQQVSGPSIRLAEVLAQQWGNLNFGYRELHEGPGMTMVLAYCYDLETNTRAEKIFHVKHVRDTKQGSKTLTDRRDIYELIANQASRRVRSCILQIIPGDVTEAAMDAAAAALEKHEGVDIETRRQKMIEAFTSFDVTEEMIERRMGKKVKALLPADLVVLRNIYRSLSDGMSSVEQWFESDAVTKAKEAVAKAVKEEPKPKKMPPPPKKKPEPEPEPEKTAVKAPEIAPEPEPPQDTPEPPDEQEAPAEPQPEPESDEPENSPGDMTPEDITEAVTVATRPGRPSNLQIQLQKHMIRGMTALIEAGIDEEDAMRVAERDVYDILVNEFDCTNINSLELNNRPGFLAAVSDWANDPTASDEE